MNLKNRQTTQAENPKVIEQKEVLQDLYGCIKDAKAELAELKKQLKDHNDLTESLLKLQEEGDGKLYDIKKRTEVLEALQVEINDAGAELGKIVANKLREQGEAIVAQTKLKEDTDNIISQAQSVVDVKSEELKNLDKDIFTKKEYLEELTVRVNTRLDQCGLVEERIAEKEKELSVLTLKGLEYTSGLLKTNTMLQESQGKYDELLEILSLLQKEVEQTRKQLGTSNEEIAQRYDELIEREGDVSSRERLVSEKTKSLQAAKKQLEEHFNKPLNNLII